LDFIFFFSLAVIINAFSHSLMHAITLFCPFSALLDFFCGALISTAQKAFSVETLFSNFVQIQKLDGRNFILKLNYPTF